MPLLVRLTNSEIEAIDLVVSQGLHAIEDCGGVVEEVGSAGLAIHEELSFPDLHVEPVHRDVQLRGQFGSGQHADGSCVQRVRCIVIGIPAACRILWTVIGRTSSSLLGERCPSVVRTAAIWSSYIPARARASA